jgi:hypothetical protein
VAKSSIVIEFHGLPPNQCGKVCLTGETSFISSRGSASRDENTTVTVTPRPTALGGGKPPTYFGYPLHASNKEIATALRPECFSQKSPIQ